MNEEERKQLDTFLETHEWWFTEKYIVPNWFLPKHLGVKDHEVDGFKKFVSDWACRTGEVNEIMEELLHNYRTDSSKKDIAKHETIR